MKPKEEVQAILEESRKYNIWDNPKRPDEIKNGCCEYCGKKHGENPLYVHVTYVGTCVPNDVTEDDLSNFGEDSQGCWPIGSTCAKKMFGNKISDYTQNF